MSGAFTQMFNAEMSANEIALHNKKILANEKAYQRAYGKNGESFMKGDTEIGRSMLSVIAKSLAVGVSLGKTVLELGYGAVAAVVSGVSEAIISSGIFTELEFGFGSTNYKTIIKNKSIED